MNEHIALTDSVLRLMQARQKSGVILNNDLTRYELKRKQLELGLIQLQDAASVLQFCHFGHIEYTDNARVCRNIVPQNARVQSFIKEIRFESYQSVNKGDTLVVLEDSEYRFRLEQALSDLARAEENSKATGSSIQTTTSKISVTEASIEEARVNMDNMAREDKRYEQLLREKAVTQQQYDAQHTAYLSAKARYEQMKQTRTMQTNVIAEQGYHLSASKR